IPVDIAFVNPDSHAAAGLRAIDRDHTGRRRSIHRRKIVSRIEIPRAQNDISGAAIVADACAGCVPQAGANRHISNPVAVDVAVGGYRSAQQITRSLARQLEYVWWIFSRVDEPPVTAVADVEIHYAVVFARSAASIHPAEDDVRAAVPVYVACRNRQSDLTLQPESAKQNQQAVLIDVCGIDRELDCAALRAGANRDQRQQQRKYDCEYYPFVQQHSPCFLLGPFD